METNYTLKPIKLDFIGSGNPVGNDPAEKAERALSQNVVYLCKNKALSAKEISEKLGVPMPFVEEELAIQCAGTNGSYGLLRRLDNSKTIANILILDVREYEEATAAYLDVLEDYTDPGGAVSAEKPGTDSLLSLPQSPNRCQVYHLEPDFPHELGIIEERGSIPKGDRISRDQRKQPAFYQRRRCYSMR